jgi:hypothetical protein
MLKGETCNNPTPNLVGVELRCKIQFHTLLAHDVNFSCHIGHYGLDFEQIGAIGPMFGELYKKLYDPRNFLTFIREATKGSCSRS